MAQWWKLLQWLQLHTACKSNVSSTMLMASTTDFVTFLKSSPPSLLMSSTAFVTSRSPFTKSVTSTSRELNWIFAAAITLGKADFKPIWPWLCFETWRATKCRSVLSLHNAHCLYQIIIQFEQNAKLGWSPIWPASWQDRNTPTFIWSIQRIQIPPSWANMASWN